MNFFKTLFSALAVTIGFSACGGSNDEPPKPSIDQADFSCNVTELSYPMGGGDNVITVVSHVKPEVTVSDSWAHVGETQVQGSAKNIYKITVTADANPEGEDRSTVATIKAGNNSAQVTLKQTAKPMIKLDPQSLIAAENVFPADGGTREIKVSSNIDFKAEATASWISITETRAMSDHTVVFSVSANPLGERREASIVISPTNNDEVNPVTVAISQEAGEATAITVKATEVAKAISSGLNIGNTMECPSGEGAWSGAKINSDYLKGIKAAGFGAVRIPCAWGSHLVADESPWTIDPTWMARVKEVVSEAISAGLYVVLNDHWDNGWLENNANAESKDAVAVKEKAIWTQIANEFNGFDERLIFAGNNEIRNGENWVKPNSGENDALTLFNQTFVDAVRATGGNNATRTIVVQTWCCNPWYALDDAYVIPTDPAGKGYMMIEVHCYDPQDYALNYTYNMWGARKGYTDKKDNQEDYYDDLFGRLKKKFVDNGYPVVLGEYGINRQHDDVSPANYEASAAYHNEYVTMAAKNNGIVPFLWETGSMMNRNNGSVKLQYLVDGIMAGAAAGSYPF